MTKEHPEYKRVREEIALMFVDKNNYNIYKSPVGQDNVVIEDWVIKPEVADQILSIKGIEIADSDQSLPNYPVFCCACSEKNMPKAQQDMLKANFIKILPKKQEKDGKT